MLLRCRPFYLLREFTVYICAVYISPDANSKLVLVQLHDNINKSLSAHLDSVFIAAGDFKFHHNITCATGGNKTLDQVYTNVTKAYKAQWDPHLDHVTTSCSFYTLSTSKELRLLSP